METELAKFPENLFKQQPSLLVAGRRRESVDHPTHTAIILVPYAHVLFHRYQPVRSTTTAPDLPGRDRPDRSQASKVTSLPVKGEPFVENMCEPSR